jgi:hypothetical protein
VFAFAGFAMAVECVGDEETTTVVGVEVLDGMGDGRRNQIIVRVT